MREAKQVSMCSIVMVVGWISAVAFLASAWLLEEPAIHETATRASSAVVAAGVAVTAQVRSYMVRVSRLVRLALR